MDSKPVYNDKYIKTTIKIFNNKINTNFHGKKMPEDNKFCTDLFCNIIKFYFFSIPIKNLFHKYSYKNANMHWKR